ncbi:MAG: hypothetical protein HXS43_00685 [Theionarchaea archaeon]|nr:hypothetical protein [Theionarchaea archaeon]
MRWFLLVILILGSLGPVLAEDILTLKVATDKAVYESQDKGTMNVTFTNNSGQMVEGIEVRVSSTDLMFYSKKARIESIPYGSQTVSFTFHCRSLEDGEYPVTISYTCLVTSKTCQGGVCQTLEDKKSYNIRIKNGEPSISLESGTLVVVDNRTTIGFKNSDEVAIDFQFEIMSDLKLQYESYIGYLLTRGSKEILVYGDPGEYTGSVRITYEDRFGREYEKTFLVRILIEEKEKPIEVIKPDYSAFEVRKVHVNAASVQPPLSRYYVYFIMLSCISLIGVVMITKLKRIRNE